MKVLLLLVSSLSRFAPTCSFTDVPKWIVSRVNSSFLYLEWEVPFIQDTVYKHEVQLGGPGELWCSSLDIGMVNWDNPQLIQDFWNDTYWGSYVTRYLGSNRNALIRIETGMVYRARVRSVSVNCGNSGWSNVSFVSSPKNVTGFLEVQGTGQYNPVDSYINLNGTYLYKGSFDGLLLSVINRCSLKEVFQQTYDTRNNLSDSSTLATKLREIDSNHLIILISSGAWEPNFNKDLSDAIWDLGGYLTLTEVRVRPFQPVYFFEVTEDSGKPYSFISVPGQKYIYGQNFEALRNLTKYYNYNDSKYNAIPTARMRVNLVFDTFRQFYSLKGKRVYRINNI